MLRVYHSNRLDVLEALMEFIVERERLDDPFEPEMILVQSTGMAQWLQMTLSQKFGIAANIDFPLPASFIWDMFVRVLPEIPKESAFNKQSMSWKLMTLLPQLLEREDFTLLRHYLTDDSDKRKLFQLSSKAADLFDQYLVYRPDWLAQWETGHLVEGLGEAQAWQAPLWKALVEYTHQLGQPRWHRANLYQRFIETLESATTCPPGLPSRVFICGISALPPVYLQALQALGKHIEIHLLFTNPCRYYWGDIKDPAYLAKLLTRQRRHSFEDRELPLFRDSENAGQLFNSDGEQDVGNPLLASWGKLGRDYIYLLSDLESSQELDAFVDVTPDNLLHNIQSDILELENRAVAGVNIEEFSRSDNKRPLDPLDSSITFHVCHSPQREVEVLHDRLLAMLEEDPTLTPRDIIVMVADIDSYSPFIQAVFGSAPADRYLPYAISDRRARQSHPVLEAFISLLSLPDSRFVSEDVLALLDVPVLAARFDITEEGLRYLRQWVNESGIRWGIDDDNVRELELPATGQHTWRFGLTRMLLGYAMESAQGEWQSVLPYDESSGLIAELVGHLASLLMQLNIWRRGLAQERPLEEWLPVCRDMLNAFFLPDAETEAAMTLIEQQWQAIIAEGLGAQYGDAVGKLLDEVGGNARLFEDLHEHIRHAVVYDALARDRALFKPVERGRVVLVRDDAQVLVRRCVNFLRLAFVELNGLFHCLYLLNFQKIFYLLYFAAISASFLSTFSVAARRASSSLSASDGSETARICTASSAAFCAPSMATVATGMPAGICTVERSASSPSSVELFTGMPMTGRTVFAASEPARCAALPAAAMIAPNPFSAALCAKDFASTGVRCAEYTCTS